MSTSVSVVAARARALAARQQLDASIAQARDRLSPGALMRNAVDGTAERITTVAGEAIDGVKARPATTAAVVSAIALVFARKPLAEWLGARFGRNHATRPRRKS